MTTSLVVVTYFSLQTFLSISSEIRHLEWPKYRRLHADDFLSHSERGWVRRNLIVIVRSWSQMIWQTWLSLFEKHGRMSSRQQLQHLRWRWAIAETRSLSWRRWVPPFLRSVFTIKSTVGLVYHSLLEILQGAQSVTCSCDSILHENILCVWLIEWQSCLICYEIINEEMSSASFCTVCQLLSMIFSTPFLALVSWDPNYFICDRNA